MYRSVKFNLYILLAVLSLQSCAGGDFERRKVFVIDEDGRPIVGAATSIQPFVLGPKQSGSDGSIWVYGPPRGETIPEVTFRLNAPGYEAGEFKFDQDGNRCVLRRTKNSNP